jgi:chemotaxis protein CheX
MNVKFLNPFLEAAYEVLLAEANVRTNRGQLGLNKDPYITDDVTVMLSLVGGVEGTVFYSLANRLALTLIGNMLGEKLETVTSLAQSGLAELGNVITGRASVKLAQAGYESQISPPTLLLGRGSTLSTLDMPRLVVSLTSDDGPLTVHLAIREGRNLAAKAAQIAVPASPKFG